MKFHGALVAEPCVIPAGEENIQLDFGTVVDRYLYLNQRTQGQQFELHLAECDLSLAASIKITFSGEENHYLPGLLALSPGSQASGIGIGIESVDGELLPLNKSGQQYPLAKGSNVILFKAYLAGEPAAIVNKTIERGPFHAVATFKLEYE
nr:fimbrial protein [Yersinia kristensenii]